MTAQTHPDVDFQWQTMIFTELPWRTATSIPTSCSHRYICQVASQQENWSVYPAHCIHVPRVLSTLAGGCSAAEMMMEKVRVSIFIVSMGAVVHFRTSLGFSFCFLHSCCRAAQMKVKAGPVRCANSTKWKIWPWQAPVRMFGMKPRLQGCGWAGHCSQGWPQARPIVAQHSVLVQTIPLSWPWHIWLFTWVKHGPVL